MKNLFLFCLMMTLSLVGFQQEAEAQVFPFGPADEYSVDSDVTISLSIDNTVSIVSMSLDTAATVNVTPVSGLYVGSMLYLKITSDATGRDVTLGTNLTGTTISGVSNKTKMVALIYDGDDFIIVSEKQID
jgi:hypothetical protein